jgi:hypothetical protein
MPDLPRLEVASCADQPAVKWRRQPSRLTLQKHTHLIQIFTKKQAGRSAETALFTRHLRLFEATQARLIPCKKRTCGRKSIMPLNRNHPKKI